MVFALLKASYFSVRALNSAQIDWRVLIDNHWTRIDGPRDKQLYERLYNRPYTRPYNLYKHSHKHLRKRPHKHLHKCPHKRLHKGYIVAEVVA